MEKTMREKLQQFKEPFYRMMNLENSLTMDEIQAMWEALLMYNNIDLPQYWDSFIENINCVASEKRAHFYECFDLYLIYPNSNPDWQS